MILLQLSAGQGPEECARAIGLALKKLVNEASVADVNINTVETVASKKPGSFKSVLLKLEGKAASTLAENWTGVLQWICESPFRKGHKRKNWYFSGKLYEDIDEQPINSLNDSIRYKTCRASGAGGQHVNTTDSAVQATHVESGISVRVESERSQHANKRLARILIVHKLRELSAKNGAKQNENRWKQHWELERGNPKRIFRGESFSVL